jgi:hypothetical protein
MGHVSTAVLVARVRSHRLRRARVGARKDLACSWPDIVVELLSPEELNLSVLRILLTKAQAMRRITPGARTGFSPRIILRFISLYEHDLDELFPQLEIEVRRHVREVLRGAAL